MTLQTHAPLPNALVLFMDPTIGEPPASMSGAILATTPSCIAVGTRPSIDGVVHITLTDDPRDAPTAMHHLATVDLFTPSGQLAARTPTALTLLAIPAPPRVRCEVWADDPSEPAAVFVRISTP